MLIISLPAPLLFPGRALAERGVGSRESRREMHKTTIYIIFLLSSAGCYQLDALNGRRW